MTKQDWILAGSIVLNIVLVAVLLWPRPVTPENKAILARADSAIVHADGVLSRNDSSMYVVRGIDSAVVKHTDKVKVLESATPPQTDVHVIDAHLRTLESDTSKVSYLIFTLAKTISTERKLREIVAQKDSIIFLREQQYSILYLTVLRSDSTIQELRQNLIDVKSIKECQIDLGLFHVHCPSRKTVYILGALTGVAATTGLYVAFH